MTALEQDILLLAVLIAITLVTVAKSVAIWRAHPRTTARPASYPPCAGPGGASPPARGLLPRQTTTSARQDSRGQGAT